MDEPPGLARERRQKEYHPTRQCQGGGPMSQRERHLVPCPACHRHVLNSEDACPFCATALLAWAGEPPRAPLRGRLGRAAVLAAGAGASLISACSSAVVEYGAPVLLDGSSMLDAADGGATGG